MTPDVRARVSRLSRASSALGRAAMLAAADQVGDCLTEIGLAIDALPVELTARRPPTMAPAVEGCSFARVSEWGNYSRCARPARHAGDHRSKSKQWNQAGVEVVITESFRIAISHAGALPGKRDGR